MKVSHWSLTSKRLRGLLTPVEEVHSKAAPISAGMLNSGRARMPLGDHPEAVVEFVEDPWKRARATTGRASKCHRKLQHVLHIKGV